MAKITVRSGSVTLADKDGNLSNYGPGVHDVSDAEAKAVKEMGLAHVTDGDNGDEVAAAGQRTLTAGQSAAVSTPTQQQVNQARYEEARYNKGRSSDLEIKPLAETTGDFDEVSTNPPTAADALSFSGAQTRRGSQALTSKDLAGAVEIATTGELAHQPRPGENPESQKERREEMPAGDDAEITKGDSKKSSGKSDNK